MTQDEIIRSPIGREQLVAMARESGAEATHYETWGDVYEFDVELLERFAALVAAHEREACAVAAEQVVPRHTECGNKIASVIRAKGEK